MLDCQPSTSRVLGKSLQWTACVPCRIFPSYSYPYYATWPANSTAPSHYKIKYSHAVPFTIRSCKLQQRMDFVCPQMSVAKVENCWLQESYQYHTVPLNIITHIQHLFRQANFVCHCTPLFTKQKAFCSISLIGVLGTFRRQVTIHRSPGLIQHTTAQLCFILEWLVARSNILFYLSLIVVTHLRS